MYYQEKPVPLWKALLRLAAIGLAISVVLYVMVLDQRHTDQQRERDYYVYLDCIHAQRLVNTYIGCKW